MRISRRTFLRTSGVAAILPLLPRIEQPAWAQAQPELDRSFAFTPRAREVLRSAANRLIPPFTNDDFDPETPPIFRGAGEEGAVEYVEKLLTAFNPSAESVNPRIYPSVRGHDDPPGAYIGSHGAPSECDGGHLAVPSGWIELPPEKELGWQRAVARFQDLYGFALGPRIDPSTGEEDEGQLDADGRVVFGTGFVELRPLEQTLLLEAYDGANPLSRLSGVYTAGEGEAALQPVHGFGENPRAAFFNLLFHHTIEGIYGDPIYGGNRNRIGWKLAAFGGPRHPEGYYREELETRAVCDRGVPGNFDVLKNF